MLGQNRNELRQVYFDAYREWKAGNSLGSLTKQLVVLFRMHPEYDVIFSEPKRYLGCDTFEGILHPFLHLGLHMSIREQIATDRPNGLRAGLSKIVASFCLQSAFGRTRDDGLFFWTF